MRRILTNRVIDWGNAFVAGVENSVQGLALIALFLESLDATDFNVSISPRTEKILVKKSGNAYDSGVNFGFNNWSGGSRGEDAEGKGGDGRESERAHCGW